MNKKISTYILSLLTVFTVACGSNTTSTVKNNKTEETTIVETTEKTTTVSETQKTKPTETEKEISEIPTTEEQTEVIEETEIVEEETEIVEEETEIVEEETEIIEEKTEEIVEIASDYKTAYKNLVEENEFADSEYVTYGLIYFDEDDIPELVVNSPGSLSMYTYANYNVYTVMEKWGYGMLGNAGYEYCSKMNSMRNYNSDFAGAIGYTTYLSINDNFELETTNQYVTYLFDDKNNNDIPDDDEFFDEPKYFIEQTEVTQEEAESLDLGEYEFIFGEMTLDELYSQLQ